MKEVFKSCVPRDDVLKGELTDEMFAARLKDVMEGTAEKVYQDPKTFFATSYPASGLKTVFRETMSRLSGKKGSPIIRLETSFGGGKTHSLIALYHVATGKAKGPLISDFVDTSILPTAKVKVAGIVGTDFEPSGTSHGDVKVRTLWGELAYQLGGYEIVKDDDQKRETPGVPIWEEVIGDDPTLIMIDEIGRYQRVAKAITVGRSTLAKQTAPFLMSLFSCAAKKRNVVVVLTMTSTDETSGDAFKEETEEIASELRLLESEVGSVSARESLIKKPAEEEEISAIVCRRLFKSIDEEAGKEVGKKYREFLRDVRKKEPDLLPESAASVAFEKDVVRDYPFHPEFMSLLTDRLSSIEGFQRTRGALRLLSRVVRELWNEKPKDTYLIHPHHIDLGNTEIKVELTDKLGLGRYNSVIEADVVSSKKGEPAHATEVDRVWVEAGKPAYAYRVATTIFLHSLTGLTAGISRSEVFNAVLQPGDDPKLIEDALETMTEKACWYLDVRGEKYRFVTTPMLNKIIADAAKAISLPSIKEEIDDQIKVIWKEIYGIKPLYFKEEASGVSDDTGGLKLVVIHYETESVDDDNPPLPETVKKIFNYAGTSGSYRLYKNNMVFLVADSSTTKRMLDKAREKLAVEEVEGSKEYCETLSEEQKKSLEQKAKRSYMDLRIDITRTYKHLYFPREGVLENLGHITVPPDKQGEQGNHTLAVVDSLVDEEKVVVPQGKHLAPKYVRDKAWEKETVDDKKVNKKSMTPEELRVAFKQYTRLKILLNDVEQIKKYILDGISNGLWVYYEPSKKQWFDSDSLPPIVEVSNDVHLFLPDAAPPKCPKCGSRNQPCGCTEDTSPELCPNCGKYPCECEVVCLRCGQAPCVCWLVVAEMAPKRAFSDLYAIAQEKGIKTISNLRITVGSGGKDGFNSVRNIGFFLSQTGKPRRAVSLSFAAKCEDGEIVTKFQGTYDLYRTVQQMVNAIGKTMTEVVDSTLTAVLTFESEIEVGGKEYQEIRDRLESIDVGVIRKLEARTGEENG